MFQEGVTELFPRLPGLLTTVSTAAPFGHAIPNVSPPSSAQPYLNEAYDMNMSRAALRPRVLIVWRKLTPSQRRRHNAQYTIAFRVLSRPPCAAVHLAFFLLHFTYTAIQTYVTAHYDYDVRKQPKIKGLAYHLCPTSADGIALYDYIEDVYNAAAANAVTYPSFQADVVASLPVSTWPPHDADLLDENTVLQCYRTAT